MDKIRYFPIQKKKSASDPAHRKAVCRPAIRKGGATSGPVGPEVSLEDLSPKGG